MFHSSSTELVSFEENNFFIKRDDLIDKEFSGNKARKLFYYLFNDFPNIKKLISYGSIQSNSMYSLSVLAKLKGWEFEYFIDHIPSYLKENPQGNYLHAINNGMKLNISKPQPLIKDKSILFIEEGARDKKAQYGLEVLANEIKEWQNQNSIKELDIFLPSGTGTTALYLQKYMPQNRVYTTPCVGDKEYLISQFNMLEKDKYIYPTILTISKKHHFGKLYLQNYEIWLKLQTETKIEFDLLYDPLGWRVLLSNIKTFSNPILYIHQGGLLGNESMLKRYKRKYKEETI